MIEKVETPLPAIHSVPLHFKYCPVPGYSDEIVHVYYAEVERIKDYHLYSKFENEEIKVSKLTLNQIKKN